MSKWFFLGYFLLIWCCTATISYSQVTKIPFRSGDLWGYADQQGNLITPPKYDSVDFRPHWFGEKCHFVYKNGRKGLVNASGQELIAPNYSTIQWNKKLSYESYYFAPTILKGYSVVEDGSIGFIDMKGRIRLAAVYSEIISYTFFAEEQLYLFLVKDEDQYRIIDSEARVKAKRINTIEETSRKNCYQLKIGKQYGIYDLESNKWLAVPQYDTIKKLKTHNLRDGLIHKNYHYGMLYKNHYYTTDRYYNITDSIPKEQLASLYGAKNPPPPPPPPYPPKEPDIFTIIEDPIRGNILYSKTITSKQAPSKYSQFTEDLSIGYRKKGKRLSMWRHGHSKVKQIKGFYCDTVMILETRYSLSQTSRNQEKIERDIFLAINQKGKWGIYVPNTSKWLVSVGLDSLKILEKNKTYVPKYRRKTDLLLIYKEGKVGLIACNDKGTLVHISPQYDHFHATEFIRDKNQERFYLYTFIKDGQKYIVGENGVVFVK